MRFEALEVVEPRLVHHPRYGVALGEIHRAFAHERHGQQRNPARSQDPAHLGDAGHIVGRVFEHVGGEHAVEARRCEGQALDVERHIDVLAHEVAGPVVSEAASQMLPEDRLRGEVQHVLGRRLEVVQDALEHGELQPRALQRPARRALRVYP